MANEKSVFNTIIKIVKILLIIIAVIAVLFLALNFLFSSTDNKWKRHFFSESDYKTVSSVFNVEENSFTLNEVIYCPCAEDDNTEVYNIYIVMDDLSSAEKTYNLEKSSKGFYEQNVYTNSLNSNIEFTIASFLGEDFNNPAPYEIILTFHGHNDELYDILPFINF